MNLKELLIEYSLEQVDKIDLETISLDELEKMLAQSTNESEREKLKKLIEFKNIALTCDKMVDVLDNAKLY